MSIYSFAPGAAFLLSFAAMAWLVLWTSTSLRQSVQADFRSTSFVPQLESLRGLLAVTVVLYHSVVVLIAFPRTHIWPNIPSRAYEQLGVGPVLMFFFLTGYLFWTKLLRRPSIDVVPYFRARLRRLLPVYLFAMCLLFLLVGVETHFRLQAGLMTVIRAVLPWLAFTLWASPDINGLPATALLIAGTTWTLAMEWRFYILLPLLVWFARKLHRCLYLFPPALVIYAAFTERPLRAAHLALPPIFTAAVHAFAGHFLWSFGVGILVAMIHAAWIRSGRSLPWHPDSGAISVGCVLAVAIVMLRVTPHYLNTMESLLLGLVFLTLVFGNTMWGVLASRPLLLLGKCSYSMYLCHGIVLAAVAYLLRVEAPGRLLSGRQAWPLIAVCGVVTFALALVCHVWIESPFLERKGHKRDDTGLAAVPPDVPGVQAFDVR